jgi:transposase
VVFFDTTSIYFEGEGGQTLGQCGHSKDGRPDLKQNIVGIAMDAKGEPLCCEMWPGNTVDAKPLLPVVERMIKRRRIGEVGIVADRGIISEWSIAIVEACDPLVWYILGARMCRQKEVKELVLRNRGAWLEVWPERTNSKYSSLLKIKEVHPRAESTP